MLAKIYVTLKSGVLDPQGQAVQRALSRLGFDEVKDARIGKYIELRLDGQAPPTADEIRKRLDSMCRDLLANTVIEDFRYELISDGKKE